MKLLNKIQLFAYLLTFLSNIYATEISHVKNKTWSVMFYVSSHIDDKIIGYSIKFIEKCRVFFFLIYICYLLHWHLCPGLSILALTHWSRGETFYSIKIFTTILLVWSHQNFSCYLFLLGMYIILCWRTVLGLITVSEKIRINK